MWTVCFENAAEKALGKAPRDVEEKFKAWALIVETSGPQGLRAIRGFRDEQLQGKLKHLRSSRLGLQWRVIYRVEKDVVTVVVEEVTPPRAPKVRTAMVKEKKTEARIYRPKVPLTPGQAVRVLRELQEMTQDELAAASGITQPTISSIESGRVNLGVERAKKLARALKVHPAVLAFSDWQAVHISG